MKDEALDPADRITIEGDGRDEWGHRFFKFAIRGSDRNVALVKYEAKIANGESRFIRITETLFNIKTDDDALIRQHVEQLIEILDDAFGVNNYARQISADFNRGFRNCPPSVHCVRSILWTIRVARTHIMRAL
jgi:hypothetical protein